MKENKDRQTKRVLLNDEQLEEIVGGAQAAHRPSWYH